MNCRLLYLPLCCLLSSPLLGFRGYSQLLDRRYDEVTFATAHNAQSNLPPTKETLIPVQNQITSVTEQLNAGIRGMKIPIFWQDNVVLATHGVNEGVKSQVRKLVDSKFDELIKKRVDEGTTELKGKITTAQTTLEDLNKQLSKYPQTRTEGYGNYKKTITIYAPDWLKTKAKEAETAVTTLVNQQTELGKTITNQLKADAEKALSPIISKKVLNIYYHPDQVKPSDLDPAGRGLVNILREVKTFIDRNQNEIVTIFLEVYGVLKSEPQRILDVFKAAGLVDQLYVQDATQQWPTLKEMIAKKKRLVVFVNCPIDSKKYPFNAFDTFVWDSAYAFTEVSQLQSDNGAAKKPDANWIKKTNKLFALQHFITETTGGTIIKAPYANKKDVIVGRAQRYMKTFNIPKPNFIWVDFFATAPLAENQKQTFSAIPMGISLDQIIAGNWPTIDTSKLAKQTDVFDAVDSLNGLPVSSATPAQKPAQGKSQADQAVQKIKDATKKIFKF